MVTNMILLSNLLCSEITSPMHPMERSSELYYKSSADAKVGDTSRTCADLICIFSDALKHGVPPGDIYGATKNLCDNDSRVLAAALVAAMYRVDISLPKIFDELIPLVECGNASAHIIAVQLAYEMVSKKENIYNLFKLATKYGVTEQFLIESTATYMLDKKYCPYDVIEAIYPKNTVESGGARLKLATWLAAQMEKRGDPTEGLPEFMKKYFEESMVSHV